MRAQTLKLVRDAWRLRLQGLAIGLLVAAGVAVTVMSLSSRKALVISREAYYAETRFADVFATATRVPLSLLPRLAQIEGVVEVDARVALAGVMQAPGFDRPAMARLISLPEHPEAGLNRLRLVAGRLPDPQRADEAVALKTFLDAAGISLGETLQATVRGRRLTFRIVGAALSPEFIYVPGPESFLPDDAHQGVFWMGRPALERAADQGGAFNALALRLAEGVQEQAVLTALDRLLAPYGASPAVLRADQVSNAFLEAELRELELSAALFPPLFLIVAAGLVHMLIARLVAQERDQIGLLKAFGYSNWETARPYLVMAGAIGALGAVLGGVIGAGLGAAIVDLYARYMRFPALSPSFAVWPFLAASLAGCAACVLGALASAFSVARLSPAAAMARLRPRSYRRGLIAWSGLDRRLDAPSLMILRALVRFPARAGMTVAGFAASLGLIVSSQFVFDGIERVIEHGYFQAQRWTDSVALAQAQGPGAVEAIRRLPGVLRAEPARLISASVSAGGRRARAGVAGVPSEGLLWRALDAEGRAIPLPEGGVVLSEALAQRLQVRPGEAVEVVIETARRERALLPVLALGVDYSGLSAVMDRRALNRLMGEPDRANRVHVSVDPDQRAAFHQALVATPGIAGAASRDAIVDAFRRIMTEAFTSTMAFYVGFAGAIAFGVAYTAGRIALSERARDLAALQVLGFSHFEIAYIVLGELMVLALIAAPAGLWVGDLLARGVAAAFAREDLRLPYGVSPRAFGVSLTAYGLITAVSLSLIGRRLAGLDLVAVLKTRE